MNLKSSTKSLQSIIKPLQPLVKPIVKYHIFIMILAVLGFLAYAVYNVNTLLSMPRDEVYYQEQTLNSVQTTFDEDTIDKISELRDPEQETIPGLPGGRINPFR